MFRSVNSGVVGDFGFRGVGAVDTEIDRWDADFGSPPGSVILATSECDSAGALLSGEDCVTTTRALDAAQNGRAKCEMVFFTTAGAGAVRSTGTLARATSPMWDGGINAVSQIISNVLERFLDPMPLETG